MDESWHIWMSHGACVKCEWVLSHVRNTLWSIPAWSKQLDTYMDESWHKWMTHGEYGCVRERDRKKRKREKERVRKRESEKEREREKRERDKERARTRESEKRREREKERARKRESETIVRRVHEFPSARLYVNTMRRVHNSIWSLYGERTTLCAQYEASALHMCTAKGVHCTKFTTVYVHYMASAQRRVYDSICSLWGEGTPPNLLLYMFTMKRVHYVEFTPLCVHYEASAHYAEFTTLYVYYEASALSWVCYSMCSLWGECTTPSLLLYVFTTRRVHYAEFTTLCVRYEASVLLASWLCVRVCVWGERERKKERKSGERVCVCTYDVRVCVWGRINV